MRAAVFHLTLNKSHRKIFEMKLFILFAIFAVIELDQFVHGADRVVWVPAESGVHKDHPGKCWSATLNREFSVGEELSDKNKCELIRCGPSLRFSKRV